MYIVLSDFDGLSQFQTLRFETEVLMIIYFVNLPKITL